VSARWLLAIDDTDNEESIGTGRLARMLAEQLERAGLLAEPSVTRHQLLVHPDIPYTSHNSSACIGGAGNPDAALQLLERARAFLTEHFHAGANPGLCVCRADAVPDVLVGLATRAQREVLSLEEFDGVTSELDVGLWWGGETGQGRIGACSGAALRSTGEDGRFIGLTGIRELAGTTRVADIIGRSAVAAVETTDGCPLDAEVRIETRDWVRPSLRGGRPVFVVREEGGRWVPSERRSKDA
jgi:tRNA(Ile2) C34 agmatinyltransferase TiaS